MRVNVSPGSRADQARSNVAQACPGDVPLELSLPVGDRKNSPALPPGIAVGAGDSGVFIGGTAVFVGVTAVFVGVTAVFVGVTGVFVGGTPSATSGRNTNPSLLIDTGEFLDGVGVLARGTGAPALAEKTATHDKITARMIKRI